VKNNEEIKIK